MVFFLMSTKKDPINHLSVKLNRVSHEIRAHDMNESSNDMATDTTASARDMNVDELEPSMKGGAKERDANATCLSSSTPLSALLLFSRLMAHLRSKLLGMVFGFMVRHGTAPYGVGVEGSTSRLVFLI